MESGSTPRFAHLGCGSPRRIATGETEGPKAANILVSRAVEAVLLRGNTCAFNRYPPSPPLLL
jgi:hypothetical protein